MAKLSDELKDAISHLPAKEKDKLLFRLIAKDRKLTERLNFELLEGGNTRDDRAEDLRDQIRKDLPSRGAPYLTPGLLMMELRHWNARITEHVFTTKDKSGEVILGAYLFREAFERHWDLLQRRSSSAKKFAPYVVKRAISLVNKGKKLHEDYHMEFRKDLQALLDYLWAYSPTQSYAEALGLPKRF
ncbi:MAG: hypothetical protein IPL65_14410 [Lewinellaceae bacterium]|nr:hypothetical protein [Lewinellaceae bacterium]